MLPGVAQDKLRILAQRVYFKGGPHGFCVPPPPACLPDPPPPKGSAYNPTMNPGGLTHVFVWVGVL